MIIMLQYVFKDGTAPNECTRNTQHKEKRKEICFFKILRFFPDN